MADGLVLQDVDGKIIYFNPAALSILGLSKDQLSGRTTKDFNWKMIREDGSDFPFDNTRVWWL